MLKAIHVQESKEAAREKTAQISGKASGDETWHSGKEAAGRY